MPRRLFALFLHHRRPMSEPRATCPPAAVAGVAAPRLLAWGVALGVCGLVFTWYQQPDFLFTLADRLWSCF